MAAIISKEKFEGLKEDSEVRDIHDDMWEAVTDSYILDGVYPACKLRHPLNKEEKVLYHDGKNIRYHDEGNNSIDGEICGELDR